MIDNKRGKKEKKRHLSDGNICYIIWVLLTDGNKKRKVKESILHLIKTNILFHKFGKLSEINWKWKAWLDNGFCININCGCYVHKIVYAHHVNIDIYYIVNKLWMYCYNWLESLMLFMKLNYMFPLIITQGFCDCIFTYK